MNEQQLRNKIYWQIGGLQLERILDEFFEKNICIPKGENRHPYADVIHKWLEDMDSVLQVKTVNGTFTESMFQGLKCHIAEYRIKPKEPVYEWQWKYKDDNTKLWTYTKYMTDAEFNNFEYCSFNIAIRDEETKRERK